MRERYPRSAAESLTGSRARKHPRSTACERRANGVRTACSRRAPRDVHLVEAVPPHERTTARLHAATHIDTQRHTHNDTHTQIRHQLDACVHGRTGCMMSVFAMQGTASGTGIAIGVLAKVDRVGVRRRQWLKAFA
eukprot:5098968-Pleurochrysis_carterae.AAC.6